MKKIAILGNSLTAVKIIEQLKNFREDVEAVFISSENTFPYRRNLLPEILSKKVNPNKTFYRPSAEYEKDNIRFVFDKKVARVNFKKGRITLEDKEQIDYDLLLLSDLLQEPFASVKGSNKSGLYNIRHLTDMSALAKDLGFKETLLVQSDNVAGLKAALALASMGKEVILVTSENQLLSGLVGSDAAVTLQAAVEEAGVRILSQSRIVEILGDTEAKAIRLDNGKVLACQAILTDSDALDLRLFKETELQHGQWVPVNGTYQTNFENVFAIDTVCDRIIFSDWGFADNTEDFSQEQALIIASRIAGKEYTPAASTFFWTININQTPFRFSASSGYSMLQMQTEPVPAVA